MTYKEFFEYMTYEEFIKFVQSECIHEAIYKDSEGRTILVITMLDAYGMVGSAQRPLVGLTDEDWKEIEDMSDTFDQGVAWCLAKLKEKNT
jgi:hypothetical protein